MRRNVVSPDTLLLVGTDYDLSFIESWPHFAGLVMALDIHVLQIKLSTKNSTSNIGVVYLMPSIVHITSLFLLATLSYLHSTIIILTMLWKTCLALAALIDGSVGRISSRLATRHHGTPDGCRRQECSGELQPQRWLL